VPFTIKFIAQFNENVTNFCFTTYVASLDVQKQRKVRLLPELCQTDARWAVCIVYIAYRYTAGRVHTAR